VRAGEYRTGGSISPVGRITCSANTPPAWVISHSLGVADTATVCGRIASHSSKAQRAIVHAGGQAKAVFGERRLAAEVAAIHAADLRNGDVALVAEHQRVVGTYSNSVGGGSPGWRRSD